jgi:hypothetical protein
MITLGIISVFCSRVLVRANTFFNIGLFKEIPEKHYKWDIFFGRSTVQGTTSKGYRDNQPLSITIGASVFTHHLLKAFKQSKEEMVSKRVPRRRPPLSTSVFPSFFCTSRNSLENCSHHLLVLIFETPKNTPFSFRVLRK